MNKMVNKEITNERNVRLKYKKLTEKLIEKKYQISTMESATAGQIASLITDTEGSSAIMKGAFVTYSNEAKIMQGVSKETIDRYSVYSIETAKEMANCCRKAYGAKIGIGVTGTMGNVDPSNAEFSSPGEVYFAIDFDGDILGYYEKLEPQASRYMYKLKVADMVVEKLLGYLAD